MMIGDSGAEGDMQEILFKPEAWYSEYALRVMGWEESALARARRNDGLRCKQIGRARWYKGAWLQEWLDQPEAAEKTPAG